MSRALRAKLLGRTHDDPQFRRRLLLVSLTVSVPAITLLAGVLIAVAWLSTGSTADSLAAVADVLSGATFILAAVAAMVAILAYAVASGSPKLLVRIQFPFSKANVPIFRAEVFPTYTKVEPFKQTICSIFLRNANGYSAKNPAVIVRLNSMAYSMVNSQANGGWTTYQFVNTWGITAVQWDGGSSYAVHGNSIRRLPDLDLAGLTYMLGSDAPSITVQILADGYWREVTVPVNFSISGRLEFGSPANTEDVPEWI